MTRFFRAALVAAGFAAFAGQAGAAESRLPASLTAFGANKPIAALPEAALQGPAQRFSENVFQTAPAMLATSFGTVAPPHNFAASVALSADLAVDTGYNVDL